MSDTDENNHLNEAGYIRFIMDACHALMPTCTKASRIKSIKGKHAELQSKSIVYVFLKVCTSENCAKVTPSQLHCMNVTRALLPSSYKMVNQFSRLRSPCIECRINTSYMLNRLK